MSPIVVGAKAHTFTRPTRPAIHSRAEWKGKLQMVAHDSMPDFASMTADALMDFWSQYHRASRKDAEAIVGDRRPGYTNIAATIANYACNLAVAMQCRARGDETAAACYDHAVRLCFEGLPADVQARVRR